MLSRAECYLDPKKITPVTSNAVYMQNFITYVSAGVRAHEWDVYWEINEVMTR